jgi:hypothetical protein
MCKKNVKNNLTKNKLWTFEWPRTLSYIFISPYHNQFWVDFSFYFLNMYIKKKFTIDILHMDFSVH